MARAEQRFEEESVGAEVQRLRTADTYEPYAPDDAMGDDAASDDAARDNNEDTDEDATDDRKDTGEVTGNLDPNGVEDPYDDVRDVPPTIMPDGQPRDR
jgi:hypothetical protein